MMAMSVLVAGLSLNSRKCYSIIYMQVGRARKQKGFTIVELLIVIVVIAILATITTVAFNGIQMRAKNTQRISVAGEYVKIMKLYAASYGSYPMEGINDWVCLGEDYPDLVGDSREDCNDVIGGSYAFHPDAAVNAEMKKITSTLPKYNMDPVINASGVGQLGVVVDGTAKVFQGEAFKYIVAYYLEGHQQDCGLSGTLEYDTGGWPNYRLSTTGYTSSDGTRTYCAIYLPNL